MQSSVQLQEEKEGTSTCVLSIQAMLVMTGKQQCMVVLQQPELAGAEQMFLMPGTVGEGRKQ